MEEKKKKCSKCKMEKGLEEFYKRNGKIRSECKQCSNDANRKQKQKRKEKNISKGGVELVVDKKCSLCKVVKNIDSFNKNICTPTGYRDSCRECDREYGLKRIENNKIKNLENNFSMKEKYCFKCKETKDINFFWKAPGMDDGYRPYCKKCSNESKKEWLNEKMNSDESYRLKCNVSKVVSKMLKSFNKNKSKSSTWKFLLYTPLQLKEHLEKQFDKNMTWDNYGSY